MEVTRPDQPHHTYGEYLTWPDDPRQEPTDGALYVSEPPAPAPIHQMLVSELCQQIGAALKDSLYRIYVAPFDVWLPKSDQAGEVSGTVMQPDLFILRDCGRIDRRGLRGAPDWVAEVLSPGTARYDQIVKLATYEHAGVGEVWLVDPAKQTLAIYRLEEGRYGAPVIQALKGQTPIAAVPGMSVDWNRLLRRIPSID